MRHFGDSVGHMQYERQRENEPNHDASLALNVSDSSDNLDTGDLDAGELEVHNDAVDSDEEEGPHSGEIVDDDEVDWECHGDESDIISDSDGGDGGDGSDSDGYGSY